MYYDYTVEIPNVRGKIITKKKSDSTRPLKKSTKSDLRDYLRSFLIVTSKIYIS